MAKTDRERQQRRRAKLREARDRRRQERGLHACPHCAGWLDVKLIDGTADTVLRATEDDGA